MFDGENLTKSKKSVEQQAVRQTTFYATCRQSTLDDRQIGRKSLPTDGSHRWTVSLLYSIKQKDVACVDERLSTCNFRATTVLFHDGETTYENAEDSGGSDVDTKDVSSLCRQVVANGYKRLEEQSTACAVRWTVTFFYGTRPAQVRNAVPPARWWKC